MPGQLYNSWIYGSLALRQFLAGGFFVHGRISSEAMKNPAAGPGLKMCVRGL